MEKFSNSVLKLLAWLCAVFFIITAAITLLLFNAERRLFNADSYLRALESQNIYEQFPALAAQAVTSSAADEGTEGTPDFLKALPAEDLEEMIRTLLPTEMSKSMAEQAVTSIFAYLNGESQTATLSLTNFKSYLGGPGGLQAIVDLLNTQPDCTFAQLAEMTALNLLGEPAKFYLCRLPAEYTNENGNFIFGPMIEEGLQVIVASLPDEVSLVSETGIQDSALKPLRDIRALMRFSPLLPFGLLFLITVFAVRDLKSWLKWWGTPFIGAGVFGLLISGSINPIFNWAFGRFIETSMIFRPPVDLLNTLRAIVTTVLSGVSMPIALQSVFLILAGIIMLLATRAKKTAPPQTIST